MYLYYTINHVMRRSCKDKTCVHMSLRRIQVIVVMGARDLPDMYA